MKPNPPNSQTNTNEATWQTRLLPLMSWVLISLAVFFFISTCAQLYFLQVESQAEKENYLPQVLALLPADGSAKDPLATADLKARIVLEEQSIRRNYNQANTLLLSRTWVRYLGFVTGMILAIVGATFILGKLSTTESTFETTTPQGNLTLRSSSPGLILAAMGTLLILSSIVVNHPVTTQHNSIYMRGAPSANGVMDPEVAPPELPDISKVEPQSKDKSLPMGKKEEPLFDFNSTQGHDHNHHPENDPN